MLLFNPNFNIVYDKLEPQTMRKWSQLGQKPDANELERSWEKNFPQLPWQFLFRLCLNFAHKISLAREKIKPRMHFRALSSSKSLSLIKYHQKRSKKGILAETKIIDELWLNQLLKCFECSKSWKSIFKCKNYYLYIKWF